jgi:hypothetical protein
VLESSMSVMTLGKVDDALAINRGGAQSPNAEVGHRLADKTRDDRHKFAYSSEAASR